MLTVAVSSRSLFHLEEANDIFESQGQQAFDDYMLRTEDEILEPGAAFSLVRKLLLLNSGTSINGRDRVEVILLSRNSANAGVRVLNSVLHYGLDIEQAVFTNGDDRFSYAKELDADLFLCTEPDDVRKALDNGIAAASIVPTLQKPDMCDLTVRIAFDGDSVLFSDEADQVYRAHGLKRFQESELENALVPLADGPFKRVFSKLCALQKELPKDPPRLITGLVTARGTPNHRRPITTLRHWGLDVNVAIFAAGKPKGPLVRAFGADLFVDDTGHNVDSATEHDIPSGLVPACRRQASRASSEGAPPDLALQK